MAVDGGEVLGWAAMIPVSDRCVYAGVAEESVYVSARARGRGVGRLLLEGLIAASEGQGVWTLQAGIFPENTASIALHERLGFRLVGRRERLGKMASGQWRDVLMLERRSPTDRLLTPPPRLPTPSPRSHPPAPLSTMWRGGSLFRLMVA